MMGEAAREIWSEAEREAWKLPEQITVSEWAEKYRVLDAMNSAEPGPWKNSRTPYMAEVMDAFIDPAFEEITVMASTQVAKSETINNIKGYVVDQDPGPALSVKAREDDAFSDAHNRLRAMFRESEQLRRHIPSGRSADLMMKEFRLDRMTLYFAGSNSPAALSGKPIRYLFLDETDKYPRFSGREASPIKLARHRTRTFWNRKIFKASTPTTEYGYIWKEYNKSDKRKYYVPCPSCGHYQILYFDRIKMPRGEWTAGDIREKRPAWFECEECKHKIRDYQKPGMLKKGVWLAEGQRITSRGVIKGERQAGNHAGFWLNAVYSPWLTFSEIMAEFVEAQEGGDEDMMDFTNSWLAEIWEEKAEYKDSKQVLSNRADYPAKVVPAGAVLLTAGVDVQKHFFYYIIRAWGAKMRSWLVDEGQLQGEDLIILNDAVVGVKFPLYQDDNGNEMKVALTCIDAGYRTDEVYDYTKLKMNTRPIKGASRNPQRPFWSTIVDVHPVTGQRLKHGGVRLWLLDTDHFKNFIFRRMQFPEDNEFGWHVHRDITLDYADQITSEKKVVVKRGRQEWEEWQPKSKGAKNHLWDCEVYAAAGAHMLKGIIEREVKKRDRGQRSEVRGQKEKKQGGSWVRPNGGKWL